MRVEIIGSPAELQPKKVVGKNVAVIDVLRATTVIVTALQNGTTAVIPKEHEGHLGCQHNVSTVNPISKNASQRGN